MRQLAPLFGVSKSAADRIIDHLGPLLALQPRRRFARDAVLIVDGTLVPTRDHTIAATAAAVSVVLRLYHHHAGNGIVMAVATPSAAVRYLIKANQPSLPVHTDTTDALRTVRACLRHQTACHHAQAAQPGPGVRQSPPGSLGAPGRTRSA